MRGRCSKLLRQGRRPLVADTSHEAAHLLGVLNRKGIAAKTWSDVATENVATCHGGGGGSSATGKSGKGSGGGSYDVIVATKNTEGQGINMQGHADAIVCRPTPGDHLEQMKGRVDRPGQRATDLVLVVLMAEHTIEEAKFANIRLAGNFFREFIAPVATRYRERIDHEAILAAGGTSKLRKGTVTRAWMESLEAAGSSGSFATASPARGVGGGEVDGEGEAMEVEVDAGTVEDKEEEGGDEEEEDERPAKRARGNDGKVAAATGKGGKGKAAAGGKGRSKKTAEREEEDEDEADDGDGDGGDGDGDGEEPKYASLNKVKRNKGDPIACREAKRRAKAGLASLAVQRWLFPPKVARELSVKGAPKPLGMVSPLRFSDATPPLVLDPPTMRKALQHLSRNDPKMEALITRRRRRPRQRVRQVSQHEPGDALRQVPALNHLYDGIRRRWQRLSPAARHQGGRGRGEHGARDARQAALGGAGGHARGQGGDVHAGLGGGPAECAARGPCARGHLYHGARQRPRRDV